MIPVRPLSPPAEADLRRELEPGVTGNTDLWGVNSKRLPFDRMRSLVSRVIP
jgi:hypothetical protein